MFTLIHAFANYLLAVPIRKRVDIIALLIASILPDLEGLYYTSAAYDACAGELACMAAYPSHYVLHSFFGIFLIVAPLTAVILILMKKYGVLKSINVRTAYLSALAGGLLHVAADATYHKGADALYLLWPAQQQFSFAFEGSHTLWAALAGVGLFAFILFEKKRIEAMLKR